MYSVGLLMYEIFCPMLTDTERMKLLNKIPKGILDEDFLRDWPTEVGFYSRFTFEIIINPFNLRSNHSKFLIF